MLFTTPTLDAREEAVLTDIVALRDELRAQLVEPRRWHGALRRRSMARAVRASNSIEGYDAALDDAAAIALDEDPIDARGETLLAHRGYGHAMTYVLQMADDPDFRSSLQLLKSLHFMMANHDLAARPDRWRAGPLLVRDAEGEVVHEGPRSQASRSSWTRSSRSSPQGTGQASGRRSCGQRWRTSTS
jgi:hypothetical protein